MKKLRNGQVVICCKICDQGFVAKKSMKDVLKTCSLICRKKLKSINSKEIVKKHGVPVERGDSKRKISKTVKGKYRDGRMGYMQKVWKECGEKWEGKGNPRWKPIGAKRNDGHGYILLKIADGQGFKNWRQEHVCNIEREIGRKLDLKEECVHHIDGDKANNNLNNLCLMTQSTHKKLHQSIFLSLVKELLDRGIVYFDKRTQIYKLT